MTISMKSLFDPNKFYFYTFQGEPFLDQGFRIPGNCDKIGGNQYCPGKYLVQNLTRERLYQTGSTSRNSLNIRLFQRYWASLPFIC